MLSFNGTRSLTTLLALAAALALPAVAIADGKDVIRDCAQDGDLDGDYSQEELDDAYGNLPSDIDEYSDCRGVIEKARERGGSGGANNDAGSPSGGVPGGGSGDSSGSDFGGSGNDRDELSSRAGQSRADKPPVASVAGEEVGNSGGTIGDDDSNGLPTPLIVAIVLALLAALAGGLYVIRDRLPDGIASRLPGSPKA